MSSTIKVNNIQNLAGDDSGFDLSTNDKIGMKIANSEVVTVDTTGVVFNENSADRDFRVESNSDTHAVFVDAGNDKVGIKESAPSCDLVVKQSGATFTTATQTVALFQRNSATGSGCKVTILSGNNTTGDLNFGDAEDEDIGKISYGHNNNSMRFHTNTSEAMRIDSSGNVLIGKTSTGVSTAGVQIEAAGAIVSTRDGNISAVFNRESSDGDIVRISQAGSQEGVISVSGSTVSYNGFSGLHESSGIPTNTPIGTIVSTIDELDVYPNTQDGDAHPKAGQTRADHAKVEISSTVGDKAVYGVVGSFNAQGKVNVVSVGIGSVRVTGACAKGDLLESNGDGTAKVQSDDIVRSKTIGKVTIGNSSTDEKLVSCVLYCG